MRQVSMIKNPDEWTEEGKEMNQIMFDDSWHSPGLVNDASGLFFRLKK